MHSFFQLCFASPKGFWPHCTALHCSAVLHHGHSQVNCIPDSRAGRNCGEIVESERKKAEEEEDWSSVGVVCMSGRCPVISSVRFVLVWLVVSSHVHTSTQAHTHIYIERESRRHRWGC
jgi:hypothetical protein